MKSTFLNLVLLSSIYINGSASWRTHRDALQEVAKYQAYTGSCPGGEGSDGGNSEVANEEPSLRGKGADAFAKALREVLEDLRERGEVLEDLRERVVVLETRPSANLEELKELLEHLTERVGVLENRPSANQLRPESASIWGREECQAAERRISTLEKRLEALRGLLEQSQILYQKRVNETMGGFERDLYKMQNDLDRIKGVKGRQEELERLLRDLMRRTGLVVQPTLPGGGPAEFSTLTPEGSCVNGSPNSAAGSYLNGNPNSAAGSYLNGNPNSAAGSPIARRLSSGSIQLQPELGGADRFRPSCELGPTPTLDPQRQVYNLESSPRSGSEQGRVLGYVPLGQGSFAGTKVAWSLPSTPPAQSAWFENRGPNTGYSSVPTPAPMFLEQPSARQLPPLGQSQTQRSPLERTSSTGSLYGPAPSGHFFGSLR